ncbi:MAG TPA: hypothetical protein VGH11_14595 [Jatrophihabitans sp.]|jgi:hypothetical protein
MKLLLPDALHHRMQRLVNVAPGGYRSVVTGLSVRLVEVMAGTALLLLPAHQHRLLATVTIIGIAIALVAPATAGSGLALAGAVGGWLASAGWQATPELPRTIAFGYGLYLLHTCCALAAAAPLTAQLSWSVVRKWSLRMLLASAGAAVLIAVTSTLGRIDSSVALQTAGVVGAVALLAIPVWFVSRSEAGD